MGAWGRRVVLVGLWALLSACSSVVQKPLADALAAQGAVAEDDLQLAREAAAFYLKLSESVLRDQPGHRALATTVASGFTQYAYAFVAFDAEQLQAEQPRRAKVLRERAARLYDRAAQHALRALEDGSPGLGAALRAGRPAPLRPEQAELAYWAAAAWGGAISLRKAEPERVAELPAVLQLAQQADQLSPQLLDGALASLLGTLEASRPQGSPTLAQAYFNRARQTAQGRISSVPLAEAEALATLDRERFERLLREALAIADQHPSLANAVMRERAQWLLDTLDERF
jgi:TRAP transporter T-component